VGKVTKPMGPVTSVSKEDAAKGGKGGAKSSGAAEAKDGRSKSGYDAQYNPEEAAAAHPAWAAKRKAANEAWGNVKPSGKKMKFDD
jgi:hypothetical protein